jgi:hypothetical protein
MNLPRRFQPLPNVSLICANCEKQAEQIVEFLNRHAGDLPCKSFHVQNGTVVCASQIKESQIGYIQGVIAGFLLSK